MIRYTPTARPCFSSMHFGNFRDTAGLCMGARPTTPRLRYRSQVPTSVNVNISSGHYRLISDTARLHVSRDMHYHIICSINSIINWMMHVSYSLYDWKCLPRIPDKYLCQNNVPGVSTYTHFYKNAFLNFWYSVHVELWKCAVLGQRLRIFTNGCLYMNVM